MAEPGLSTAGFRNVLSQRAEDSGWALCIGAGTSQGALPDWKSLVDKLIKKERDLRLKVTSLKRLWTKLTPEALVQASKNRLRIEDEAFAELLSHVLYADFKNAVGHDSWQTCAQALSAVSPGQLNNPSKWKDYVTTVAKACPGLSALSLAETIYEASSRDRKRKSVASQPALSIAPAAILSFNAEPLLFSLINAQAASDSRWTASLGAKRLLDRVNRGISYRSPNRIPYIFLHGLLPVPGGLPQFERVLSAEKLVFSEGEYLAMANTSFSWASSMFLSNAVLRTMVFVGLSFTDQNLRRWLAWVHDNKRTELEQQAQLKGTQVTQEFGHYWINRRPKTRQEESWMESSVEHLGVRLVWIDEWREAGYCLGRALGL